MELVNFNLLKHPLNWLTIVFMLFLAAMLGTLVLEGLGITPSTGDDSDSATS